MRARRFLIPLLGIVLLAGAAVAGTLAAGNEPQLGLDLQGGFSVVLTATGDPPEENVEKAKEIIRQRIDALGVAEPEVTRQGRNVLVELPGVDDRKKAQEIVGETAKLEFRPVLQPRLPIDRGADDPCAGAATPPPDGSTTTTAPGETTTTAPGTTTTAAPDASTTTASTTTAPAATGGDDETGAPAAPVAPGGGEVALGRLPGQPDDSTTTTAPGETTTTAPGETTTTAPADGSGPTTTTSVPAEGGVEVFPSEDGTRCVQVGPVGFEGDALSSARAELATGEWQVAVRARRGQRDDANATFNACYSAAPECPQAGIGDDGQPHGAVAIVLDDVVISDPLVNAANLADDQFVITGDFTSEEAKDLALVLRYGALPVEFARSAEQQVSATLGEDSLNAGLVAGLIGIGAVALYMLLYYRGLGLVVILGLSVWGALMYAVVCYLSENSGLALSLAGVTGIIVSVGTTVDSYVVYFERLKDEVHAGRSVRSSTERGFARAFRTILTADVSSFIGAFLLWWLTVGPVRGFAFFLGLSVILDVVVAYFFTRPLVALLSRNRRLTENRLLGVTKGLGGTPQLAPRAAR